MKTELIPAELWSSRFYGTWGTILQSPTNETDTKLHKRYVPIHQLLYPISSLIKVRILFEYTVTQRINMSTDIITRGQMDELREKEVVHPWQVMEGMGSLFLNFEPPVIDH